METTPLKEYVAQSLAQGMRPEEVRAALISQGWTGPDIDQALSAPATPLAPIGGTVEGRPKRKIVIAAVAVLILGAGGAFAYLRFFAETPDERVAKAVNAAIAAKSVEYAASLRIEAVYKRNGAANPALALLSATNAPEQPVKLLVTAEGAYDRLDAAHAKSRTSVTIATTQVLGGVPLGTLEVRQVNDATYLSLTRVPVIHLFDLSALAGVWVKFDRQALTGLIGSATAAAETPKEGPTAAQIEAIEEAFTEHRPVHVVETLKDEDIDGTASRHYRLAVDKQKLRAFLLKVQDIMDDGASLAYEKLSDDYDKFSEEVEIETLEVWIGKAEGLPTRLLLQASAKESEEVPGEGSFTLDVTFKNFGKPIQIEAPADAKSVEEVFGMLMGGMGGAGVEITESADARSEDARRYTDVRQIQTALELAFAEANNYPIVARPILISRGHTDVLCMEVGGGAPIWARDRAECGGTLFIDLAESSLAPEVGEYVYAGGSGGKYTMQFELAVGAGPLEAGPQCANPNGIEWKACDANDRDADGLSDADESQYKSDAGDPDTDDDGYTDGAEVAGGYDPNGPGKLQ